MWEHSDYCDGEVDADGGCAKCEEAFEIERIDWHPMYTSKKQARLLDEEV
jgi:hypothetical protein